jgi:hypothetical protein
MGKKVPAWKAATIGRGQLKSSLSTARESLPIHLTNDAAAVFVLPQLLKGGMAQLLIPGPASTIDLGDQLGRGPDDAVAGGARQLIGEWALFAPDRLQLLE